MRPYRKEKVASTIRDIVSNVVAHKLQDPRIDSMTTITRVVMSDDLLFATIYVSVHGGGVAESKTLSAIKHARGYIQRIVAHDLTMRQCPELQFELDNTIEAVRKTMELLDENLRERLAREEANGEDDATRQGESKDGETTIPPGLTDEGLDR